MGLSRIMEKISTYGHWLHYGEKSARRSDFQRKELDVFKIHHREVNKMMRF